MSGIVVSSTEQDRQKLLLLSQIRNKARYKIKYIILSLISRKGRERERL